MNEAVEAVGLLGRTGRRAFLGRAATLLSALALGRPVSAAVRPRFAFQPFGLGVASGDPHEDGVVLWTRLVGDGSAVPASPVRVDWEVAADESFRRVVRQGSAVASPELAHSVHVEVSGLEADREYWYRFVSGGEASAVGRTRTAPAAGQAVDALRFAFASCQHYEQGYYTSLRHLSAEDVRFVVHLGDYIYEDGVHADRPRQHDGPEILTLDAYRRRYALYKSDADLQAAHAAAAWIVTWDDHEVDNNYAGDVSQDDDPRDAFLARRAAAYQAFYEHMPVRAAARPRGPDARLYRRLRFGDLIELSVLDTRQYRTDQPCGDGRQPRCAEAYAESATMFGATQERWLLDGLTASRSRWDVLANQVMIAQLDNDPGAGELYGMDRWDGYVAARRRLLSFLADRRTDAIVLTGDIHANWVADLKTDFASPRAPIVGAEFVGTSLSSGGDGEDMTDFGRRGLDSNPHLHFFNGQRGYVRCTAARDLWTTDYRVVDFVSRPGGSISTRASFVVERGRPGVT